MNIIEREGKVLEEVLQKIKEEFQISNADFIFKTSTKKGGLLKKEITIVSAVLLSEIQEYAKEFMSQVLKNMGLEVTFETRIRDEQISIKMYSDKNSILIGKNGQTLTALQTILRQAIFSKIEMYPYVVLDVENYKDKKVMHLERLAKNIAREVAQTGVEVKLESMNSYERRIVHSILSQNKKVCTISEGEEPNRYIVVRLKDE